MTQTSTRTARAAGVSWALGLLLSSALALACGRVDDEVTELCANASAEARCEHGSTHESPLASARKISERRRDRVVERIPAGSYTYHRLESAPAGSWHVVMGQGVAAGERVDVVGYAESLNMKSRALNRTFERVVYSQITAEE